MAIGGSGVTKTITAAKSATLCGTGVVTNPLDVTSGSSANRVVQAPAFDQPAGLVGAVSVSGVAHVPVSGVGVATTSMGSTTISIVDVDATPPVVSLSSSATDVSQAGAITLTANATDNVGVTRVDFFRDGLLVGSDTASPFTVQDSLTAADNGSRTYTATAYDAAGNLAHSDPITVTVSILVADSTPPTVSLDITTSTVTSAGPFSITATASDNNAVARVEFYRNGQLLFSDETESFSYVDLIDSSLNGTVTYQAVAYDFAGNSATSQLVSVTVNITDNPRFSTALQTLLNAETDKASWLSRLISSFGATRTATIKHAPAANQNASASDAWSSGTTVGTLTFSGAMTSADGAITSLGSVASSTLSDANLSAGAAVLRIEGNGHWMQGTLGLTGSGREFVLTGNLTATSGIAFSSVSISAPASLPATGTTAPTEGAVPVGAYLTDITLTNTSASTATNQLLTFGQPFKRGAFPGTDANLILDDGAGGTITCQFDKKGVYDDGSVRHAIISAVVPTMSGSQTKTYNLKRTSGWSAGTPATAQSFVDAGLASVVTITTYDGTVYTASLAPYLTAGTYTTWLSGDVCSEWHVTAPLKTAGGVEHDHLHVRFAVRAYKGQSKARVDVTVENTWLKTFVGSTTRQWADVSHTRQVYAVNISVGGVTVYTYQYKAYQDVCWYYTSTNNYILNSTTWATGLANDSTVYTATFTIDGVAYPVSIIGSQAQNGAQLLTKLQAAIGSAGTVSFYQNKALRVMSATTGAGSSVSITNGNLLNNLTNNKYAVLGNPIQPAISGLQQVQIPNTRWRKVLWWNASEPTIHIAHNKQYLVSSYAVPSYDLSLTASTTAIAANKARLANPLYGRELSNGLLLGAMGTTGGRPDIGVLPWYAALYVLSQSKDAKDAMLQQGDLSGSWSMFFRDKTTDRPVSIVTYPYVTNHFNSGHNNTINPATGKSERTPLQLVADVTNIYECVPDTSHHPDQCYLPYIVTGDYYYLEGLVFTQRYCMLSMPPYPDYRNGAQGLVYRDQVRGQGWQIRTTAHAWHAVPDDYPLRDELASILQNNLDWYNTNYLSSSAPFANVFGATIHANNIVYSILGNPSTGIPPWMEAYLAMGFARMREVWPQNTALDNYIKYKARLPVGLLTSGSAMCWQMAGGYTFAVRATSTSPLFTTFGQMYNATFPTSITSVQCGTQAMADAMTSLAANLGGLGAVPVNGVWRGNLPESYIVIQQCLLAFCVDAGATGARDALDVVMSRSNPCTTFNANPQFAIVPRT